MDPNNVKGLYRAGKIALEQDLFKEAELALAKAAALEPKSREIYDQRVLLREKKKQYRERDRKVMKKMAQEVFGGTKKKGGAVASAKAEEVEVAAVAAAKVAAEPVLAATEEAATPVSRWKLVAFGLAVLGYVAAQPVITWVRQVSAAGRREREAPGGWDEH